MLKIRDKPSLEESKKKSVDKRVKKWNLMFTVKVIEDFKSFKLSPGDGKNKRKLKWLVYLSKVGFLIGKLST